MYFILRAGAMDACLLVCLIHGGLGGSQSSLFGALEISGAGLRHSTMEPLNAGCSAYACAHRLQGFTRSFSRPKKIGSRSNRSHQFYCYLLISRLTLDNIPKTK
ncbi:hypothetical protein F5B17DRAFT_417082 [Nemania serpens]|nr:hypothetical protein F5B17DRAFT_417082 [Nemania serpens]